MMRLSKDVTRVADLMKQQSIVIDMYAAKVQDLN